MVVLALLLLGGPAGWTEAHETALANAEEAHRAFSASHDYLQGWLAYQDPETKLIPQNVNDPHWTAENSAADHYAFMVLTCHFTDPVRLATTMREILDAEMRISTRVRSLPETVNLSTDALESPTQGDHGRMIFGASEYCKDGLLPIAEVMGRTPWFDRLEQMARDIIAESDVETPYGRIPSGSAEVNGELLQVLCRLHAATGDPAFLDAALAIADAYFFEVLPGNGGIPCHVWDFSAHRAVNAMLNLSDHGSEIIGGLSESFIAASVHRPDKAAEYEPAFRGMLDTVLDRSTNTAGILSMAPEGSGGVPDTWGYVYNAYYSAYMFLGEERYRDAVLQAMDAICAYTDWGGADAYADCEESALVLLNREPNDRVREWLRVMLEHHYAYQQADGVIEGWYGDGNSARTWQMYAMMMTAGTRAEPWRDDLRYGAAIDGDALAVVLKADARWEGKLYFDRARHHDHMGLTLNYPRLNEWPEWWVADPGAIYEVRTGASASTLTGYRLIEGLAVTVEAGKTLAIDVRKVGAYPHNHSALTLAVPNGVSGRPRARAEIGVTNTSDSERAVVLSASEGALLVERMRLAPGETRQVLWSSPTLRDGTVAISAHADGETGSGMAELRVLDVPGLLDYVGFSGGGAHAGHSYQWLGDGPISEELHVGGASSVTLRMLWGGKGDVRSALLRVNGHEQVLREGGHDGFEWVEVEVQLDAPAETVDFELLPTDTGPQAFLAEMLIVGR